MNLSTGWGASDIALIITSSAALGGVFAPLVLHFWKSHQDAKLKKRDEVQNQINQLLGLVIEHGKFRGGLMDAVQVGKHTNDLQIVRDQIAFDIDRGADQTFTKVKAASIKLMVTCEAYGVDAGQISETAQNLIMEMTSAHIELYEIIKNGTIGNNSKVEEILERDSLKIKYAETALVNSCADVIRRI